MGNIHNTDYIGIIGAMKIEVDELIQVVENKKIETVSGIEFVTGTLRHKRIVVAQCGIGKVNAAMCAQTMILKYNPTVIINIGVAGGDPRKVKMGDVVIGESTIQHDFDTSPVGDPPCLISGINLINIPCDQDIANKILISSRKTNKYQTYLGVIATGDKFMNSKEEVETVADTYNVLAFDMESASIGQVCYINKVKFATIRAISDSGGDDSFKEYDDFLHHSAQTAINTICDFLDEAQ